MARVGSRSSNLGEHGGFRYGRGSKRRVHQVRMRDGTPLKVVLLALGILLWVTFMLGHFLAHPELHRHHH